MPHDKEQMPMHLNGNKNSIKKKDFIEFAFKLKIDASVADKIISRQIGFEKDFDELISISFLPGESKKQYRELLHSRIKVMEWMSF